MEVNVSSIDVSSAHSAEVPPLGYVAMKLEVVNLPVSDVDRAKRFYQNLGWWLDGDFGVGTNFRAVQLTSPHSPASITFGKGVTTAEPGSIQDLMLIVDDIEAAREELIRRGVDVSDVYHYDTRPFHSAGTDARVSGPDPQGPSYFTWASFRDPDGNGWLLQEIKTRLPGREWED
jgi:catechol 2,3-dioxygenase-like lactoylglutathione lyase family enzyme